MTKTTRTKKMPRSKIEKTINKFENEVSGFFTQLGLELASDTGDELVEIQVTYKIKKGNANISKRSRALLEKTKSVNEYDMVSRAVSDTIDRRLARIGTACMRVPAITRCGG